MLAALRHKFEQHRGLREMLLQTGTAAIRELAPNDRYWGCGADGTGRNRLGNLIMQVRDEFQPKYQ